MLKFKVQCEFYGKLNLTTMLTFICKLKFGFLIVISCNIVYAKLKFNFSVMSCNVVLCKVKTFLA
jgi:hypothetical protein